MLNLFISYCHADREHEVEIRKTLNPLVIDQRIRLYSDQDLLAGQRIRKANDKKLLQSHIVLFLITRDFISSPECQREWQLARDQKDLDLERKRIPILISACPWRALLKNEDLLVIPNDAKPLLSYQNQDEAWKEIYEKIDKVISHIETNRKTRSDFHQFLEQTDITGDQEVRLSSSYVFGRVQSYDRSGSAELGNLEGKISNIEKILERDKVIIHGEPMSGKTALAKMLCIRQIECGRPVLYIDAKKQSGRWNEKEFRRLFEDQFLGSWDHWLSRPDKLIVIDDLSEDKGAVKFLESQSTIFRRVIITMDTDIYRTYYHSEQKTYSYTEMQLREISRWHQEQIIRKTLKQTTGHDVSDGEVDIVERKLNEVVDTRIIPRYPFYVLSVIQALQVFMPPDSTITSHAHCYHVFILGRLIKAGVEKDDGSINACLNFAERLAKAIFDRREKNEPLGIAWFNKFVQSYQERYVISDEQIKRMCHPRYGILHESEGFRIRYMEFYFFGRFLARNNNKETTEILHKMCQRSEVERYHLALLFVIHHADSREVLETIMLNTMCSLESVQPATLDQSETDRFQRLITQMKSNVLTKDSVADQRRKSRDDDLDYNDSSQDAEPESELSEILKVLKNNRILGQVLRTRHGNIEKDALKEIIEAIVDGGLRVVNTILSNKNEIDALARWVEARYPSADLEKIKRELTWISFIWTMNNIEMIVDSVNKTEVRFILKEIVREQDTPAYDLVYYFSELDNSNQLNSRILSHLKNLSKKRKDPFIRRIASIRTQFYMNTHSSKRQIEQQFCDVMKIKYIYRPK